MLETEPPADDDGERLRIDLSRTAEPSSIVAVLADEDCRAILAAADSPMTAGELIDACDIPRATVYRKLKRLEAASLVRSSNRIADEGVLPTQYRRTVDRLLLQPVPRGERR